MNKPPLGTLERVDLRDYWSREDSEFTPWLAEEDNITRLGDALGLDLEVQEQEASVGPFRADILCRETADDSFVLIENQLERTDHNHLGQILTYAAGLDAVTIVWIAGKFTEEHRAALDWFNRVTHDDIRFFGIEVELLRIGDSMPAPRFNIVAKPNDWSKSVKEATRGERVASETREFRLDFWRGFVDYMERRAAKLRRPTPKPTYFMKFPSGRDGIVFFGVVSARDKQVAVNLLFRGRNAEAHYGLLEKQRDEIDSDLGFPVDWRPRGEGSQARIMAMKEANTLDRDLWPELYKWLLDTLESFDRAVLPRIRRLDVSNWKAE